MSENSSLHKGPLRRGETFKHFSHGLLYLKYSSFMELFAFVLACFAGHAILNAADAFKDRIKSKDSSRKIATVPHTAVLRVSHMKCEKLHESKDIFGKFNIKLTLLAVSS